MRLLFLLLGLWACEPQKIQLGDDSAPVSDGTTNSKTDTAEDSGKDSGNDSGEDSGTTDTGETQVCGVDPVFQPPNSCPAVCTGGCDGSICRVDCSGIASCITTIDCPPGMECAVDCSGIASCEAMTLNCANGACSVDCSGIASCEGMTYNCGMEGTCSMACSGEGACNGSTQKCGTNQCTSTCTGAGNFPAIECGASCDCSGC